MEFVQYDKIFKAYETVEWPETGEVFEFTRVKVCHILSVQEAPEQFRSFALFAMVTRVDGRELTFDEIMRMDVEQFAFLNKYVK